MMSGAGGASPCPECGGEMQTYMDWKPYDIVSGECLDCGFSYYTAEEQLTLEQVNERRALYDLEPLKQFKKQVEEVNEPWKNS